MSFHYYTGGSYKLVSKKVVLLTQQDGRVSFLKGLLSSNIFFQILITDFLTKFLLLRL
jgi:hypothetical protein